MTDLFLRTVNLSYRVSFLILAILLLRLVLKKAPKWISVALWGIAAVRLLLPFSLESIFSMVPSGDLVTPEIMLDPTPTIQSGIPVVNDVINPILQRSFAPNPGTSMNPLQLWIPVAAILWLAGFAAMVLYTLISYWKLKREVSDGVEVKAGIYRSRNVPSPFVLGLLRPRIYLPEALSENDAPFVIAHEEAHIRRRDHWWKPFGFLLLSIHWFNPLMWLGYIFLCRDIELACDEKVIDALGEEVKADYSQALLNCSVSRKRIAACPLAFGEVGVKQRIKSVLHYKKPAFWILVAAIVISIIAAVCFLTDPMDEEKTGVQSIRVTGSGNQSANVLLDYNYLSGGYSVEMVPFSAQEYGADGMIPYDGALGKYRVMITFGDTAPAASLSEKFPNGQIYELEDVPKAFGGSLKARIARPQGHGFVLYIGSDVPFTVQEESKRGLDRLFGHIKIEIEKINVPGNVVTLFEEDADWSVTVGSQVPGKPSITVQVDRDSAGITHTDGTVTTVLSGMPIRNAFFCDLNGDGVSELCACTSWGSGIVDDRIIVYDFINEQSYSLADRGNRDYHLSKENGTLIVTVTDYRTKNIVAKGQLVLEQKDDEYRLTFRETTIYVPPKATSIIYFTPEYDGATFPVPGKPDTTLHIDSQWASTVNPDGTLNHLFFGWPLDVAYFCDLNQDGVSELCVGVTMGSGISDHRICVYDFANEQLYELADRLKHDYCFFQPHSQKDSLGILEFPYGGLEPTRSGYLLLAQQADGSYALKMLEIPSP